MMAVVGLLAPPATAQTTPRPAAGPPAQAPAAPPAPMPAPAPSSAPVASEPRQTTAAFGDWVLRCVRQGEGGAARRLCEVSQSLQVQGAQGPIAQVAFGRTDRSQPLRLTALLPNNITLPSVVRLLAEENDPQPVELTWRRCVPGACVADFELAQPALNRLRARTEAGRISFKDATGRDIALPISLLGLAQALDAFAREGS